jgi:hypothetical protein
MQSAISASSFFFNITVPMNESSDHILKGIKEKASGMGHL